MNLKDCEYSSTRANNILKKRKIYTAKDLLEEYRPKRYIDFRTVYKGFREIENLTDGKYYAIECTLQNIQNKIGSTREFTQVSFKTKQGERFNVFLFNMKWLYHKLKNLIGREFVVAGKVSINDNWISFANPMYIEEKYDFVKKIETVYRKSKGLSNDTLEKLINYSLNETEELLDAELVEKYKLMPYKDALIHLHRPVSPELANQGYKRLIFNDLLFTQLNILKNPEYDANKKTDKFLTNHKMLDKFIETLPYDLTADQEKVIKSFIHKKDNEKFTKRLNMLLQGDVGCGKTVVAMALMMLAYDNGYQAVLMAPRGVLAKQHYEEVEGYASKLGIRVAYLGGDLKEKTKKEVRKQIKNGEVDFIVGTHAVFSDSVEYKNLGVVIVDEEHLFGVKQKRALEEKANEGVHALSMSATPIPRTLLGIFYSENKDVFEIKTKPSGRKDIITRTANNRLAIKEKILEEIKKGHQCYVVCPAIEDDEENLVSVEQTVKEYNDMLKGTGIRIGTLHGKMDKADINDTIDKFSNKEMEILISTTVVEVGVNVPNATLMIIEQAKQFGLASMHQLRGRVGRSSFQSYCYLLVERQSEKTKIMCETNDGFKIAEADLKIRGAGEIIGTKQSGYNKYVNELLNNPYIYKIAKECANDCIKNNMGNKLFEAYNEHFDYEEE